MCDDITGTIDELAAKGVTCGAVSDEGWGLLDQRPAARWR